MRPPAGYIEIDRRFSRLRGSDRPEELAAASYLGGSLASSLTLGWTELLKERLVVVLGEPGNGKSWEFRPAGTLIASRPRPRQNRCRELDSNSYLGAFMASTFSDLEERHEAILGFINGTKDDFYCADPGNMYSLVQGYVDDMSAAGMNVEPRILDFLDQIEVDG